MWGSVIRMSGPWRQSTDTVRDHDVALAVVDDEWASWSVPGIACYGDSGAPTFFNPDPFGGRSDDRIVAVVSDGGWVCFSRDDRARVDTVAAQDWISRTIARVLSLRP